MIKKIGLSNKGCNLVAWIIFILLSSAYLYQANAGILDNITAVIK